MRGYEKNDLPCRVQDSRTGCLSGGGGFTGDGSYQDAVGMAAKRAGKGGPGPAADARDWGRGCIGAQGSTVARQADGAGISRDLR